MKRVLFALITVLVCGQMAQAEVVTGHGIVSGYAPGEFAVRGERERLASNIATTIIGQIPKDGYDKIVMVVVGSADHSGKTPENDELGLKRAEQVKSFLRVRFPEAEIITQTVGDERNDRAVYLNWKIYPKMIPVQTRQEKSRPLPLLVGLLAVMALVIIVVWFRARKDDPPVAVPAASSVKNQRFFETEVDGVVYSVLIKNRNGQWILPFTYTPGVPGGETFRQDWALAKKAAVRCLRDPLRIDEISNLIISGEIKMRRRVS